MVRTASNMLPLGTAAPDFSLPDVVSGRNYSLSSFQDSKALLVMFICRHCPYVQHVKDELVRLGKDYEGSEVAIVAISSNDADTHPEDSPAGLREMAETLDFRFPFLYDETQNVAKSYTAACTPDFFLFGQDRKLIYRGQLDDSRPRNDKPVTGKDLRGAIENLLAGRPLDPTQRASLGCNIKWKTGNEPGYFTGIPAA